MAELLSGTATLSAKAIEQIAERSDGIPLFIEELARSAREESATGIPATLVPQEPFE